MKVLKNSNVKQEAYEVLCNQLRKKAFAPLLDVDTRWNSTYAMLFRAKQMSEVSFRIGIEIMYSLMSHLLAFKVLDVLCAQDQDMRKYWIELDEWLQVEHLLAFLKLFAEMTAIMSSQTSPTLSNVIVYFNVIMDHLDTYQLGKECQSPNLLPAKITQAAEATFQKIAEYYNKTNDVHCIVTLLDPRFNLEYYRRNGFTEEMIEPFMSRYVFKTLNII
jgi:hypothetical protein